MSDDYFDLIIWHGRGGIHGFQLCYGKPRWERALTWINKRGFSHTEVDAGESSATRNHAPILMPAGTFPAAEVIDEFERRAIELPEELRGFVVKKICEFAATGNG